MDKKYIIFQSYSKKFALSINHVERVLQSVYIQDIPDNYDNISGVINYQSKIIPVINTLHLLFSKKKELDINDDFIIVNFNQKLACLWVDKVFGVVSCKINDESNFDELVEEFKFIKGVLEYENEIIPFLDLELVLNKHNIGKFEDVGV